MPGYSGTPLWKKLGYKPGMIACAEKAPANYVSLLELPVDVPITWSAKVTLETKLVHMFSTKLATLDKDLKRLRKNTAPDCAVWVSWPKQASGVATDVSENRVRDTALPLGFVDIKVCAVDATWSGLKLVIRKELR